MLLGIPEEGICRMNGCLWRLPKPNEDANEILQLEKLTDIDVTPYGTDLRTIAYHPTDTTKAISVVDNNFVLWDLADNGSQVFCGIFN